MKQNKPPMLFDAIGNIPDEYITEAANAEITKDRQRPNARKHRLIAILAASLAILLIVPTIALFAHFSDPLVRYRNHPYYAVIASLMKHSEESAYLEDLERGGLFDRLNTFFSAGAPKDADGDVVANGGLIGNPGATSGALPDGNINSSQGKTETTTSNEITDNQVEGVLEADIIKRNETHIVYLNANSLRIYTIEGENSRKVADVSLLEAIPDLYASNFYLNGDTVLIEGVCIINDQAAFKLVSLSLEDCLDGKINETPAVVTMQGNLLSTRLAGESLLVMTHFRQYDEVDIDSENYLPHYQSGDDLIAITPDSITVPDTPSSANYTVLYLLDAETLTVKDSHALLGAPSAQYVSQNTVYLASESTALYAANGEPTVFDVDDSSCLLSRTTSYIEAVRYTEEGFEALGGVTVVGEIKDQYSLDEYENVLRVAVTTRERRHMLNESETRINTTVTETNASLYLVSLEDFSILSSAIKFAPKNETVQSARFDETVAYICTAEVITFTDPVYRFDLSDPHHITSLDTGTIDGYSTSLIELEGGDLLGIGYGDEPDTLKLEIYRKGEASLVSVTSYEIPNCVFSENYKSYYINRNEGLFGIPVYLLSQTVNGVTSYESDCRYLLLHYDGTALTVKETVSLGRMYYIKETRGFVDDNYLYVVFPNGLIVELLCESEAR